MRVALDLLGGDGAPDVVIDAALLAQHGDGARRAGDHDLPVSALLPGVEGVVVVGHGAATAADAEGCVASAVAAFRGGLLVGA